MKGLLIKDFRLLKGQVYFLLIVTGCVIVFMINGSEAFGVAYVCSMVALLSLTTVSYDEYENGCAFLFTLPITKKDYVKEKYYVKFSALCRLQKQRRIYFLCKLPYPSCFFCAQRRRQASYLVLCKPFDLCLVFIGGGRRP